MKGNYRYQLVIVAVMLAVLVTFEIVLAGDHFFVSDVPIRTITTLDNIIKAGISEYNDTLNVKEVNNYLIVPNNEYYTKVRVYINNDVDEDLYIRAFFCGKDGFKQSSSARGKYDEKNKCVEILTGEKNGSLKLKFISVNDFPYEISVSKIELYRESIITGKRLLLEGCGFFIGFSVIFYLLLSLIVNIGYSRSNKNNLIWTIIICSMIFSVIILLATDSYFWKGYFHAAMDDTFMDYFNMLNLHHADDVYITKANYPAMCFLMLDFMFSFLHIENQSINNSLLTRGDGMALRTNSIALMGYVISYGIALLIIGYCIKYILKENELKKVLLLTATGPMLYLIERGNILLISVAFLMIYIYLYDSEDRRLRYCAYIALSISASLKLYPALFGMLTLKRKNLKETIHLAVIGFVTFVLPFFYYGGISAIEKWFVGMSAANDVLTSSGIGASFSFSQLMTIIGLIIGKDIAVSQIVLVFILILVCVLAYVNKIDWETLFLIATACIWFPAFSFTYMLVLYLPALITYLNQDDASKSNYDGILLAGTQLMYILPMLPYIDQYIESDTIDLPMTVSTLLINLIIFMLFVKVLLNMLVKIIADYKNYFVSEKRIIQGEIVTVLILVITISIAWYNRPSGFEGEFSGRGTSWNPYKIQNSDDFIKLSSIVNDGEELYGIHFIQTADIEFDEKTTVKPIGWGKGLNKFAGTYDGNGHSIKNYYSVSDHDEDMGLFGTLSGEVRNVFLENCNIGGSEVGGIAHKVTSGGKIINCSVNGLLWGYQTGGIAAINMGKIENCVAFVSMDSTEKYGIAEEFTTDGIVNTYSNIDVNTNQSSIIDGDTLTYLNNHVDLNNKTFPKKYKLCSWTIDDGLLKISR